MSGKSFFILFFFCLLCPNTFSQPLLDGQGCHQAETFKTSLSTNPNQISPPLLMQALHHPTVKNIMDFCEKTRSLPAEQMSCLKNLSADSSPLLNENIQRFLFHIEEWFSSPAEMKAAYNKEKEACPDYYSYGGRGYCILYTGRECWDEKATTAVITHIFSYGGYYQVREFLTAPDEEGTVSLRKERLAGTTYHNYQPAIIRVFKK